MGRWKKNKMDWRMINIYIKYIASLALNKYINGVNFIRFLMIIVFKYQCTTVNLLLSSSSEPF